MTELPVTSYGRKVVGEKSRLASLVMSFFLFAGLGMIYAGNLRKGLIFFIADIVMLIMIIVSYVWMCVSMALSGALLMAEEVMPGDLTGILVPSFLICIGAFASLVLRIVSMVFGYQMCKENNTLWTAYLEEN
ncbi:MAG TPA: hypothetical protein O0X27_03010 [Methanocorpusculum sp.]|nr:hypothetical protein [Methanocorpusculum sp.]